MYCLQYTKSDELLTPPVIKLAAEDVKKFLPDGVKNFLPTHVKNSLPHDVKKFLPCHVKNSLPCGCKITLPRTTEQGLAALIYGEQGVSSLPIQDITGEYIDTDNEYMYYYSAEFVK